MGAEHHARRGDEHDDDERRRPHQPPRRRPEALREIEDRAEERRRRGRVTAREPHRGRFRPWPADEDLHGAFRGGRDDHQPDPDVPLLARAREGDEQEERAGQQEPPAPGQVDHAHRRQDRRRRERQERVAGRRVAGQGPDDRDRQRERDEAAGGREQHPASATSPG